MMSENKKDDSLRETIRKLIADQIITDRTGVMGEDAETLVKTALKIIANLPENEFVDDKKVIAYKQLYFTINNDVGLVLKYGDNLYWLQQNYVVRMRKIEAGTTTEAFKKRELIASDVLPPSGSN
jgi:hypothetical protein